MNTENILNGKKIILGITGSIATYKTPMLVRELVKNGASVRVAATPSAEKFVSFMVLENLTHAPVIYDIFDESLQDKGAWHIELAHWADALLIAPCSATTLSKLANGNCDNAVSCIAAALPRDKHTIIAPAMDFTMYEHPATQNNIQTMLKYGSNIILPDVGELASGLQGSGRLPDSNKILNAVKQILSGTSQKIFNVIDEDYSEDLYKLLKNKKVMITAGTTHENIDAVRFIANHSTGKMGYALAQIAAANGAEVTLISGPTSIPKPNVKNLINITTAEEMYNACISNFENNDIAIMAAAVADYTPMVVYDRKLKKEDLGDEYAIKMKKTKDILASLGQLKKNQILVGFALETNNELINAQKKLNSKNCDLLVLNSANKVDSGFGYDNNTITILSKNNEPKIYSPASKLQCAKWIFENLFVK